jgi:hypothetical protein
MPSPITSLSLALLLLAPPEQTEAAQEQKREDRMLTGLMVVSGVGLGVGVALLSVGIGLTVDARSRIPESARRLPDGTHFRYSPCTNAIQCSDHPGAMVGILVAGIVTTVGFTALLTTAGVSRRRHRSDKRRLGVGPSRLSVRF